MILRHLCVSLAVYAFLCGCFQVCFMENIGTFFHRFVLFNDYVYSLSTYDVPPKLHSIHIYTIYSHTHRARPIV